MCAPSSKLRENRSNAGLGFIENDDGFFYNTTLLIAPEGILLKCRKTPFWVSIQVKSRSLIRR
jgi:hypothetical protein